MKTKDLPLLRSFFLGKAYPAVIAALVLLAHLLGAEILFAALILTLTCAALLVTGSVIPLVAPLLLIFFGISVNHSPSEPIHSEYFESTGFILTAVILVLAVVVCLGFTLWRRGSLRLSELRRLPFLVPSGLLVATLLLNGVLAEGYVLKNLFLALLEGAALTLILYIFVLGLRGEDGERVVDYFIYVSAILALLLVIQTLLLYTLGEVVQNSAAVKTYIFYGWGVGNTCGQALTVTLPVLFLGAMRSRRWSVLYLPAALLALIAAFLTLSRNALLVAAITTLVSLVIGCLFGKSKLIFRILIPAVSVVGAAVTLIMWDKVSLLLSDLFDKGLFFDNGRFLLWSSGIEAFLENPIFGKGFYGLEFLAEDGLFLYIDFFPRMLHNTALELLAATGICGFAGYAVYRFYTARVFFKRPTLSKTMLGLAVLTLLVQSLLDNFIFYVQPTFYYSIAIALAFMLDEGETTRKVNQTFQNTNR